MRRAKEEQEKREEEEYLKLKASFIIEDQGEEEQLTQDQVTPCIRSTFCFLSFFGCVFKVSVCFSFIPVTQPFARVYPVY